MSEPTDTSAYVLAETLLSSDMDLIGTYSKLSKTYMANLVEIEQLMPSLLEACEHAAEKNQMKWTNYLFDEVMGLAVIKYRQLYG